MLPLQTSFNRSLRRPACFSNLFECEGLFNQSVKLQNGFFLVLKLRPVSLDVENKDSLTGYVGTQFLKQYFLLFVIQQTRIVYIKPKRNLAIYFVNVLPPRAAAS